MKLCEQGKYPTLIVFPEGGTTNGSALLKFAKGAFMSLGPIKPETITYHAPLMDITNGCIPFESHFMIMSCNPFSWAKHQEYPVFKPNDYFWTHH